MKSTRFQHEICQISCNQWNLADIIIMKSARFHEIVKSADFMMKSGGFHVKSTTNSQMSKEPMVLFFILCCCKQVLGVRTWSSTNIHNKTHCSSIYIIKDYWTARQFRFPKFFLADLANLPKDWYLTYFCSAIGTIQNHKCSTIWTFMSHIWHVWQLDTFK